jgi:hypothetical protein
MASFETDDLGAPDFPVESFERRLDVSANGPEPIRVANADLVFEGAYSRHGFDLVISRGFDSVVLHDYFRSVEHAAIQTSGGASLSGAVVVAMTTSNPGEAYAANAPDAGAPKAIGRVEVVNGTASAIRNGQTLNLHVGDLVYKGDAVESGANSTLGLTFLDGTAFSLSSNARMVLNEMVYDPASTSNSSLLTLVQGSIGFVAGNVAHTGDMKVDTPVATMGIRGTAVHVVMDADHGRTHFSVMREPSGRVGRYVLYDHNDPTRTVATVDDVNVIVTLEIINGQLVIETTSKSTSDFSDETALTQFVFQVYQIGQDHPLLHELGLDQPGGQQPQGPNPNGPGGGPGSSTPPDDTTTPPLNPQPITFTFGLFDFHGSAPGPAETSFTTVESPVVAPATSEIAFNSQPSGGVIGSAATPLAFSLLSGAVDTNPGATFRIATNAAGQPAVTVGVASGNYNAASVAYTVDAAGNLHVDPAQFSSVAPGTAVTLTFGYTVVDSAGASKPETATLTVDGGSLVTYAPPPVGLGAVTVAPTIVSPEGGDTFAIDPPGELLITQAGQFGVATINTKTGVIVYTPSLTPGAAGVDTFTITDTDSAGVSTKTTVNFDVDGGTLANYATTSVDGKAVTIAPSLTSPEGGDHFALASAAGAFGTAAIDAATGAITYTPGSGLATSGVDVFTVEDTDALGVTTKSSAAFDVSPSGADYPTTVVVGSPVTVAPTAPPRPGDHFSLASPTGALGTATIDGSTGAVTFTPNAEPGHAGDDVFTIVDTSAGGVETAAGVVFTVDGGAAVNYARTSVAGSAVTVAPTLASPEGGDHFVFLGALGAASSEVGGFGTASINPTTGAISYAPSAAPGHAGDDAFTIQDTDALGAITTASAVFAVDGGTAIHYAATNALGGVVAASPTLTSPEGGDHFAFSTASGPAETATGTFGTATIDPTTGAIAYTPMTAQGVVGADNFTVDDTDARGVTTSATATFTRDSGPILGYATTATDIGEVTVAPIVTSPAGADTFAFASAAGPVSRLTGAFGAASIDAATGVVTYTPDAAPGQGGDDAFTVVATDPLGVAATAAVVFKEDGGASNLYAASTVVGQAIAVTPTTLSSVGGDRHAFVSGSGVTSNLVGKYGAASIDAATGAISYNPTAIEGGGGTDTFVVSDTDARGVTTTTAVSFLVDGGPSLDYEPLLVEYAPVTVSPYVVSFEGADSVTSFALMGSSGLARSLIGDFGTATIDPYGGAIVYTPAVAPGVGGVDFFKVAATDALGMTTTTSVAFVVDGGTLATYAPVAAIEGKTATSTPTLISPDGDDVFAFQGGALAVAGLHGAATISARTGAIDYTANAAKVAGEALTDHFTVVDTDANGVTTTSTATFAIDGGPLVSYAAALVGATPATIAPTWQSPEGGDAFAFVLPAGGAHATMEVGAFGTATIDAATGAITFTPSANNAPGVIGDDAFAVTDTDALGITTQQTAHFQTDTGSAIAYAAAPIVAVAASVLATPTIHSPAGGDHFAFAQGGGSVASEAGAFGMAVIAAGTGVVTFTPDSLPAGTTGTDAFTISDTDALGVVTSTTVGFFVDGGPRIEAPVSEILSVGVTSGISGVGVIESGALAEEIFTVTLDDGLGLLSATGAGVSGAGTTHLVVMGALTQVNADLATLTDTLNTGAGDTLIASVADSLGGGGAQQTIAITATGLTPVISAPASESLAEGVATTIPNISVSETGAFAGETFTVVVGDSLGLLAASGDGVSGAGTEQLTITGTLARVNAALATVTDTLNLTTSDTIHLSVDDSLGDAGAARTIDITTPGLTPVVAAPTTVSVMEGVATAIANVGVSETGAVAGETFTVVLGDSVGELSATGPGVSGAGTTQLTLHGALAQVNSELATLTDTLDVTTSETLYLNVDDSFGNAGATQTLAISTPGLTPIISAPTSESVTEGVATAIPNVSVSETGALAGETFTVELDDASGLLAATGVGVTGAGATQLTVSGTLAQVNAALATLTDTLDITTNDTIYLNVNDSLGNSGARQTIAISTPGLTPILSAPANESVGEGVATAIPNVSVFESGALAGEAFTVGISDSSGLLSATGVGVAGAGTTQLSVTGTLAQVNAALAGLTDTLDVTVHDTIYLNVDDSLGNSGAQRTIAISTPGLTPVISAPASESVGEGVATAIPNVSVSETGAIAGETFTVELDDASGLLSATGVGVAGGGATELSVSGTLAQVNAALATLTDTLDVTARDTIYLNVDDSLGNAGARQTIAISTPGLTPIISAPATESVVEGSATAIPNVVVSEAGAIAGETFTAVLYDSYGALSATGTGVSGAGTSELTVTGTLTQLNAELATLKDTLSVGANDTIYLNIDDSLGNVGAQHSIAISTPGLTPVIAGPASESVTEGVATAIPNVSASEIGAFAGETFTAVLGDSFGMLSAAGAGVSGAGSTELIVTGTLAQVNAALATLTDTLDVTTNDAIYLNIDDSLGNMGAQQTIAITTPGLMPIIVAPASASVAEGAASAIPGVSISEAGAIAGETFSVVLGDSFGLLSARGEGVSGAGSSQLTITGSLAQVNADLATLTDKLNATVDDTIALSIDDSLGNTGAQQVIAVTTPGLTPVISAPADATVVHNVATAIPNVSLAESDNVAGETFSVSLSDLDGLLSATGAGVTGAGTTQLTVAGSLSDVNAALASLTDSDSANNPDVITLTVDDSFGNVGAQQTIQVATPTGPGYAWDVGSGTWNVDSGGDWNPPGDDTIPTADSDTRIGSGAGGTVTMSQSESIGSLTVTSGYTLEGPTYDVTTSGNAAVESGGVGNLDGMSVGGALTVGGTLTLAGVLDAAGGVTAIAGGVVSLVGGEIDDTLISGPGTFQTAANGAGELLDVTIADGATFTTDVTAETLLAGAIVNNGAIDLIGGGDSFGEIVLAAATTLSGSGALVMSARPNDGGYSGNAELEGADETLTLSGSTIEGTGIIGAGALAIDNGGVIEATSEGGTTTLLLDNTGGLVNSSGGVGGLLEAANGALLLIDGVTIDNAGGAIAPVDATGVIELDGATVQGGLLNNLAGGTLKTFSTATLDGSTASGAVTIEGVYIASDNATTNIAGSIVNNGTLEVVGGGDYVGLLELTADVTLTGSGALVLVNQPNDGGYGGAAALEGVDDTLTIAGATIEGTGTISGDDFTLINAGVIDAKPEGNTTTLSITNSGGIVNASGLLEATDGATLSIGQITVDNANGDITVGDSSSTVKFAATTILGGTLNNTFGGVMETAGTATLDGSTASGAVTINGVYTASDGATTNIAGSIVNSGEIHVLGGADADGILYVADPGVATLTGGGSIVLINSANDGGYGGSVYVEGAEATLINVDNTILGTGVIGDDSLRLINGAVIAATPESNTNTLTLNGTGGIVNDDGIGFGGTLEAMGGGALTIGGITVNNDDGLITVLDASSVVTLNNATLQGGTLTIAAGGTMTTSGTTTLDALADGPLRLHGVLTAGNNATTDIVGDLVNNGEIKLVGGGDATGVLNLTGAVSLNGPGEILLYSSSNDGGYGGEANLTGADETLTNNANTILGTGAITSNLAIINGATIEATPESNTSVLTLDNTGGVSNFVGDSGGLIEAGGGGTLSIGAITIDDFLGVIETADASSHVELAGATIQGGTLDNSAGGTFYSAGSATLDGSTSAGDLTIKGLYTASNASTTHVAGSVILDGGIEVIGGGDSNGILALIGAVTLTGGGTVTLSAFGNDAGYGGNAYIEGANATLTNVDDLIQGTGVIGDDGLAVVNRGVIEATPENNTSVLTILSTSEFINADQGVGGLLVASGGATLAITDITVSNAFGVITVDDSTSALELTNASIVGGTLNNLAGGSIYNVGTTTFDGSTAAGPVTINGAVTAMDNAVLDLAGSIVLNGAMKIVGGGDHDGIVSVLGAAALTGGGTITLSALGNDAGYGGSAYIEGYEATLTNVDNTIQGTGIIGDDQLAVINGGVIDATPEAGTTTLTITATSEFTNSYNGTGGLMEASGGATLAINGVTVNNALGDITVVDASSALSLANATIQGGRLNNAAGGSIHNTGTSTLDGGAAAGAVTIDGAVTASNGATLALAGAIVLDGSITVKGGDDQNGILAVVAATTLTGGIVTLSSLGNDNGYGGAAYIEGAQATLTSVGVTIQGAGVIGDDQLAFINGGVIDATPENNTTTLTITGTREFLNADGATAGLLEASNGGTLDISEVVVGDAIGAITVNAGGAIQLTGATIQGGTLNNLAGGSLIASSATTLDGSGAAGPITINGNLVTSNASSTDIAGSIVNHGRIQVLGGGDSTGALQLSANVALTGGGSVWLDGSPNDPGYGGAAYLQGYGYTLTNIDNTIYGAGIIGGDELGVINGGVIDATPENNATVLTIEVTTEFINSNAGVGGLLEATGGGELSIQGITVNNAGGAITVGDALSSVVLSQATIQGGVLDNLAGGNLETAVSATLNGSAAAGAVTLEGVFVASNNATTYLVGSIVNEGTIQLIGGQDHNGLLTLTGPTILTGGGDVELINHTNDSGYSGAAMLQGDDQTLFNADNTIYGTGVIGDDSLAVFNGGVIDATPAGGAFTLTLDDTGGTLNSGLLEAANGATLYIETALTGAGQIAIAAGSTVEIGVAASQMVTFRGLGATLKLDAPTTFAGTLAHFAVDDTIELVGATASHAFTEPDGANTDLVIAQGETSVAIYTLEGSAVDDSFNVTMSGGNSFVTMDPTPTIAAPRIAAVSNATPTAIGGLGLSEPGAAVGESFTVTLDDAHGVLSATGSHVAGAGGHALVVTGTLAQVDDALGTVTDERTLTSGDETITISASDSLGVSAIAKTVELLSFADDSWNTAANGDWATGANWSAGSAPGAADHADIAAAGAAYTVTVSTTVGVGELNAAADATIDVTTGHMTISGAGVSAIAGTFDNNSLLDVENGALVFNGAAVDNSAAIEAGTTSTGATLVFENGATVSGSGSILLSGDDSVLRFVGDETLDANLLLLGGDAGTTTVWNEDLAGTGATLTLGPDIMVLQTGAVTIESSNNSTAIADTVVSSANIVAADDDLFLIQPNTFINHGEIDGEASAGVIDIVPTDSFVNYGTVAISNGETATIGAGFVNATEPGLAANEAGGVISVAAGSSVTIAASEFVNNGALEVNGGAMSVTSPVTGTGSASVGDDGVLTFQTTVAASETVSFTSANATLGIGDPEGFQAHISGIVGSDDVLDLAGFTAAGTTATTGAGSYNGATTTLTVHDSANGATAKLTLAGDYSSSTWTITADAAHAGVDVVDPPAKAATSPIVAGSGDQILTSLGGGDTFVFKPNMGNDEITNFHADAARGPTDTVDVSAFHFANYQALLHEAADTPAGEVITLDGHALTLDGVHGAELHASLFLL